MELNLWLVLFQGSLFLFTLIALNWVIYRPLLAYLAERERNIEGMLRSAQLQEDEAKDREQELSERLAQARGKGREALAQALAEARGVEEEAMAQALAQANEHIANETARIESEEQKAQGQLEEGARSLARDMAGAVLGRGLVLLALVSVSVPAFAAEEAHHSSGPPWKWIIYHFINLVILAWILRSKLSRPLADFLAGRRAQISDDLDHAQTVSARAQERIEEVNVRMKGIDQEESEIIARATDQAERERTQRETRAQKMAEDILEAARLTVREEQHRAQTRLRAAVAHRAGQLAGQELESALGEADDQRLWQESLDSLSGGAA